MIEILLFPFKLLLVLLFFPLYLLLKVLGFFPLVKAKQTTPSKGSNRGLGNIVVKLISFLAIVGVITPLWVGGYVFAFETIKNTLGYTLEPVLLSGTGSMYPTFPKGVGKTPLEQSKEIVGTSGMFPYPNGFVFLDKRYFGYEINRGDIVVFENEKTDKISDQLFGRTSGWVKRVIGLAGDTIELRDGLVYLNGSPLKEPYTAKARSTFGEDFLSECKKITVPTSSLFVMGDNRKGSGDSREIGFIKVNDVNHVLPFIDQTGSLVSNFRDTSNDLLESSKIKLDKTAYLQELNSKRIEAGVKPLKYQPKLETSAYKRGAVMLKYDDLSFEATSSGYTMSSAMADAGYSNIVYGEAPTLGYYEADELLENQFEFPQTKEFLLNKDYQEVGISEVEGEINGCPTQVIVQHFAGYVPPNYKKEDIQSWSDALSNLNKIIPSWEEAVGWQSINQDDLSKLLTLLKRQKEIANNILYKMEGNKWLTKEEQNSINEFEQISNESGDLAKKLNGN